MISKSLHYGTAAALCLLLGAGLRFAGLTRGTSDFVLPEAQQQGVERAFYTFHPDEETLIRAALTLDWQSPFDPPFTSYGLLPLYLARTVLVGVPVVNEGPEAREWSWRVSGLVTLADPEARRRIYLRVRVLAALVGCALPALVLVLGQRLLGPTPALLAASFVAFAPLAVQQAHFFTVDGFFAFFALVFFCALHWALERPTYSRYVLVGLAIGAAAAVRLNGMALGLALIVGHCAEGGWRQVPLRLRDLKLWAAALAALGLLLVLQPYLLWAPERLWQKISVDDFAYVVDVVVRGTILVPFSLADMHTVPYLHFWTHLWPQGVGWPLTLGFAGGMLWVLWHRRKGELPALVWCLVSLAMIGDMHSKYIRYVLPLLPLLSLFAAGLCQVLWRRAMLVGGAVAAVLLGYTAFYGLAFTRIYLEEDSRIQAGRFLSAHAEDGARIGVESGGFSMKSLISGGRYVPVNSESLFWMRHYLSCTAAADVLWISVRQMDYIAAIDVNRYRQFVAVPALLPAAHSFYRNLWSGELGFERMNRFKVYPHALGVTLMDDEAEVSFLGYDHPAVLVFRRQATSVEELEKHWVAWQQQFLQDERCADRLLAQAADHFRAGAYHKTLAALDLVLASYPQMHTAHLLQAFASEQIGAEKLRTQAAQKFVAGYDEDNGFLVPWAAATTSLTLGLPDVALSALDHGVQLNEQLTDIENNQMATSYLYAGLQAQELGYLSQADEIYDMAAALRRTEKKVPVE